MQRILIANRGEIAVRVIRACAEAGLTSIVVYADQDADAMHVRLADEAYGLGGDTAATSYLSIDAVLRAAARSGADAVHPGYGFLSESAEFARAVEDAGLIFIGPAPETIEALGDKVIARRIAQEAGAPLVPGTAEPLRDAEDAVAFARESGLPVVIKAAHGGGGRGLRVVREIGEVPEAFASATREAVAAFGRGECFIERFLDRPRHVEAQIVGDGEGRVVVVGDRDCSLQRRNQKLVEEAPAPDLPAGVRERIHAAAHDICAAVGYRGAGTVEFLVGDDGTVSFLEVNTRLQVEHPVTELTSGVDLVAEQLRIAAGRGLSITSTPEPTGHAIELRINAEDPGRGFLPSPGTVGNLRVAGGPGVRWDGGVEAGDRVEAAFDSLMGKLILHGEDRDHALARARRALRETDVVGVATVLPFARAVLEHEAFTGRRPSVYTQWIEEELLAGFEAAPRPDRPDAAGLNRVAIEVDGRIVRLGLPEKLVRGLAGGGDGGVSGDGEGDASRAGTPGASVNADHDDAESAGGSPVVRAPVTGSLVRRLVPDGAEVASGDSVAVCEAMKMETTVAAPAAGRVRWIVDDGSAIRSDDVLAHVEPTTDDEGDA